MRLVLSVFVQTQKSINVMGLGSTSSESMSQIKFNRVQSG